jgi:aspartate-semialdehyde dehydrogenase
VVATYQSVSGTGKEAMDELWLQTKGLYVPGPGGRAQNLPQADRLQRHPAHRQLHGGRLDARGVEDGGRDQEDHGPVDQGHATCVRVPVFVGHSEAINVEFEEPLDAEEARDILRESPGVLVIDKREDGGYMTPVECVGEYATYVSRIREDSTLDSGLNLWVVSDNLRKGAALNAVQIAELLGRRVLKKG